MKKIILFFGLFVAFVAAFQNCSQRDSLGGNASTAVGIGPKFASGSQPYDGMAFVRLAPSCPDGTIVESRIVYEGQAGALLERANCAAVSPPLAIALSQFTITPANNLVYQSTSYEPETPAIALPPLTPWYLQLTGALQANAARIFDIDMFGNDASQIGALQAQGHAVLCNFSAGTVESWAPDASQFAAADIGSPVSGGSGGENYVDIRSTAVRALMLARLDLSKSKGCDGIDFDNDDAYANNSGFPISASDQVDYNSFLAYAAHDRGMIAALRDAPGLVSTLAGLFDLSIAEQCFDYNECGQYQPFAARNKAVLAAEYTSMSSAQCAQAKADSFSLAFFPSALDGSTFASCQ